jgi:hypothetical protein
LLPPRLVQPSSIDSIKAKFIDELKNDGLGCRIVAMSARLILPNRQSWGTVKKASITYVSIRFQFSQNAGGRHHPIRKTYQSI